MRTAGVHVPIPWLDVNVLLAPISEPTIIDILDAERANNAGRCIATGARTGRQICPKVANACGTFLTVWTQYP